MHKICLTGYSFVFPQVATVFRFYPHKDELFAVIPKQWKSRKGKLQFTPQLDERIMQQHCAVFNRDSYPLGSSTLKGFMPGLFPELLKRRKDIKLVFNSSEANLLYTVFSALCARFIGARHAFYTWENVSYEEKGGKLKSLYFKFLVKFAIRLSDGVVCGNKKAEHIIRRLGKVRTAVFPHSGINTERFHPDVEPVFRKKHALRNKLVFAFAGGLDKRKGVDILFRSFKEVHERHPEAHLLLAGIGDMEFLLKEYVTEHNLEEHVTFLGWVPNEQIHHLYASADVFVYPSIPYKKWEEQFGNAMAEASACGKPVVASHTGSIDEVVEDERTGLLVEPGSEPALTTALLRVSESGPVRKKMGEEGRAYIEENYSLPVIAHKFYDFFHDIAGKTAQNGS